MKKVSIIVPVYNVEKYLDQCVESLVNQTLQEIEIILVNDCSPDNSLNIMKKWQNLYPDKIKIIDSPVNLRQGGARNLGLNIAEGEYIAFVDSDDFIDLDAMEKLYEKVKENKVDVLYSNYLIRAIDKSDKLELINHKLGVFLYSGKVSDKEKKEYIISGFSVCNCLYKREFIENNKIRFPEKIFFEDEVWTAYIVSRVNSVDYIELPFYYYRIHSLSTIQNTNLNSVLDNCKSSNLIIGTYLESLDKNVFYEEIEWVYIFKFFINFKWGSLIVKPYLYENMKMGKTIKKEFPKFKNNKYYKGHVSARKRLNYSIWDKFPKTYVFFRELLKRQNNKKEVKE